MAEQFKPRVVIFLGAGINKPLGIPTSGEFFLDKCYEKFKEKNTFLKIAQEIESSPENADLEKVLIKIEKARTVTTEPSLGADKLEVEARGRLGDEIYNLIYEKCSKFDKIRCIDHYEGLFTNMGPQHISHLSIFTTNYDRTVESFFRRQTANDFQVVYSSGSITRLWDGFVKASKGGLVWRKWAYAPLPDENKEGFWDIPFYKMHGSIGWIDVNKDIVDVGSDLVGKTGYPPLVIFPGDKDLPDHEICIFTRQRLREELDQANCVVIIGFSFRDDYIAEIFNEALERNTDLVVTVIMRGEWAKDSKIYKFRNLKSKVGKIDCYFGKINGERHAPYIVYNTSTKSIQPSVIESK